MLATLEEPPLCDPHLVYEPKYDGIRAVVEVEPGTGSDGVRIWSRLGNEKTAQFPELIGTLDRFRRKLKGPVLLDGEIVALDESGEPAGFQRLQGRIHLTGPSGSQGAAPTPVALIAFDVLRDGSEDLRALPLTARRARLERIIGAFGRGVHRDGAPRSFLRLGQFVPEDGRALYKEALARGWEGLIAKVSDSPYRSGRRSPEWRKLKIVRRQEFVIGGWTEPRRSRSYFGALLLGVYENGAFQYVGHTGTGFSETELARVENLLRKDETKSCPFAARPKTNERPHWTEPRLVAEIKFTEWTTDGKLRNPVYMGLRDDVQPKSVHREPDTRRPGTYAQCVLQKLSSEPLGHRNERASVPTESPDLADLLKQLEQIEDRGGDGSVTFPYGDRLEVSHLKKIFWPSLNLTKGELMRYYVRMSPFILPAVRDRPLVMKRFPNGVKAEAFYQQRAPEDVPQHIRVEVLPSDSEVPSRLIGGSLKTLLYMTQLAVISQDPWFSRVQSPEFADHVALDLDPMPEVPFSQVLDVARWIHDELEKFGIPHVPKTSGATGLHIYIPLPPATTYETGRLLCQIIATIVGQRHPKAATVTRTVQDRGRKVYVDYLQNIRGKTIATAYSARANEFAGASAPLTWHEIDEGVDPRDFTILTLPARVRAVGDLWENLRASPGADLHRILDRSQ
jgi:bifunctional non-homologous end joining protein LigD